MPLNSIVIGAMIVFGILFTVSLLVIGQYVSLRFQTLLAGAPIPLVDLMQMRLRGIDPKIIAHNHIAARKAGLEIPFERLVSHHVAGGNVAKVVQCLAMARAGGLNLSWNDAASLDLMGDDVIEFAREALRAHASTTHNPHDHHAVA
jgi:uncharacterized protein YqfA (UPF0365 family)